MFCKMGDWPLLPRWLPEGPNDGVWSSTGCDYRALWEILAKTPAVEGHQPACVAPVL